MAWNGITDEESNRARVTPEGKLFVTGDSAYGVPAEYTKQTANGDTFILQAGQLNHLRLRPQIMNEHAESSRVIQGEVNATSIVGQIFQASHDNINGLNLTFASAAGVVFDTFETYANDAALQGVWIATDEEAVLDTGVVYSGTQAMKLDADNTVNEEWAKSTGVATDFTGYNGEFYMYSNKEWKDAKLKVFIEDSSGNTSSRDIVQSDKDVWTKISVPTSSLVGDGTPADVTDVVKIGFRVSKEKRDAYFIIDDLISVPGSGSVQVKLWNMGDTLPTTGVTKLTDGTQYTKLGDAGITGLQEAHVNVDLLGGKRMYHIDGFVAGVAREIPTNELLTVGNYYAITIHYVDTDVNVYGPNHAWDDYYESGFGFTTTAEGVAITAMGASKDIQFIVFSTQEVYVYEITVITDGTPNGNSETTVYVEDENMKRTDVLVSGIKAVPAITTQLNRPFFMSKGSKFEQEYNDDITDDVSSVNLVMQYYFIPITGNG